MTDGEIGQHLGRTGNAIKIRRLRKGMPAHSRRPGWLTGHQAAKILGVDIHCIMKLSRLGILPVEIIPGVKGIMNIQKTKLYMWAIDPENWIYFKVHNVKDEKLRKLLSLKAKRWNDAWWTPGEAAAWHGVDQRDINRFIHNGKLRGKKWGNWWIKKSEALKKGLYFPKGKGCGYVCWSDDADEFIIRMRILGKNWADIGRLMKIGRNTVEAHFKALERRGEVEDLMRKYGYGDKEAR